MTTVPTTITQRVEVPAPPSARAAGAAESGVTMRDILAILRRRSLLIIFLFLLFSSFAVGAWLIAYLYFPLWPAEAAVECISDKPKRMDIVGETPDQKEFDRFIMTQAQFVTGPEVLMETLQTAEVRGTRWYRDTPQDDLLLDFLGLVKAAPKRGTNLLSVSVKTRSKDDPHVIVNQVVRIYLERVKEYNAGEFRRERDVYRGELETIHESILDKEKQLAEIQTRLPPGYASTGSNPVFVDYTVDRETVNTYQLMFRELEGLFSLYEKPGGTALSPEDAQLVELDPKVAYLTNQAFSIQQQLAVTQKHHGANHRAIIDLNELLEVVNQQLEVERHNRLREILAYKKEQVRTAMLNAQYALLKSQEKLTDTMAYLSDMDELVAQYLSVQDDVLVLKDNREIVASYIRELERIVRERSAIRVEPRVTAMAPLERSFPQRFLIPAGIALALVFAVGIAIMLEFVDTSLRTPQDIVRHLRIPLLGVIPDVDDEEVEIEQIETAVRDAPQSMYTEVFRTIRTNLQFTATAERQRCIVITSPRPEDGKTSIACNLALMIAEGGRRVLLVDANFRKPAIHRFFKPKSAAGLSNILVGDGSAKEVITKTDLPNMDVLTSGPLPPNPAELMSSQQLIDFIAEVRGMYDHVIVDSAPVLVASDASILATRADGVILVCRAKANSRGIAGRACGLLGRMNAHIFGAVLNAAQVRRGGYFREQLRTFYDYRPDEDDGYGVLSPALPRDKTDRAGKGSAKSDDAQEGGGRIDD